MSVLQNEKIWCASGEMNTLQKCLSALNLLTPVYVI